MTSRAKKEEKRAAKAAAKAELNQTVQPEELNETTVQPEASVEGNVAEGGNGAEPTGFEQLLEKLSPELKLKAQEQLRKLVETQNRAESAKQWVAFDKEMQETLGEFIDGIAKKHEVDLTGRRIVITYPDGKFSYTHGSKGTAGNGGGRTGGGGFTSHGKVQGEYGEHNSLHALAVNQGWQYEGRRTAWEAIEKPQVLDTKVSLGFTNSIENKEGVLIVTKNESNE